VSPDGLDLNPSVLGPNIAAARRRATLNQAQLSAKIGMSRPTLVAIETGQRLPSAETLAAIAKALAVRIRDLVMLPVTDESALVRFRGAAKADTTVKAAVEASIDLGRYTLLLEESMGQRHVRRSMPPLALDNVEDLDQAAEHLALSERGRLQLGDGPLLRLRTLLEQTVGIDVFALPELSATKVAGLFTFANDRPLVGVNAAQNDSRRIRWTLAHEYAHFLTNRYDAEVTYFTGGRRSRDPYEVFADKFAAYFLMPSTGLSRAFAELRQDSNSVSVGHILMLAAQFEVSFQAMCERLEEMDRIPRDTYASIMARGLRPIEAERKLGIVRNEETFAPYPQRYLYMISVLHRSGRISEGDAVTFLRTDRLSARGLLADFDGGPGTEMIDEPLAGKR
jgi:Zn-dependent peptidase ImmA (M78 family)/transcriptional regulator with XRE-family HTH domain